MLIKYTEFKGTKYVTLGEFSLLANRVSEMEEALRFYAAGRHIDHSHGHPSGTYLKVEDGKTARGALDGLGVSL